jgi:hypothetical protein
MAYLEILLIKLMLGILFLVIAYTIFDNEAAFAVAFAYCAGNLISILKTGWTS